MNKNEEKQPKQELYPENQEITFLWPNTNAVGKLKEAEEGATLTSKYRTREEWAKLKDKPQRCFYLGLKEAEDDQGGVYYLAKLHDGKNAFVAGQTILVQSLSNLPNGQGVMITCTGTTGSKKIPTFDVVQLGINLFDNNEE